MITFFAFVFVLGVLIFVHELGHFLVAKAFGIRVFTFSFGFGPKVLGRRWGETEYVLSLLPLGGYVKMFGEEPGEEIPPGEQDRAFNLRPLWQRATVVAAGPLANLAFASLIFASLFTTGVPKLLPVVGEVVEGFPAAQAGLRPGDEIVAIDGRPIDRWDELLRVIPKSQGRPLTFEVRRGGELLTLTITPKAVKRKDIFGEEVELYQVGIVPAGETVLERHPPHEAFLLGMGQTWAITRLVVASVWKIVKGVISAKTIGGPIMIAQMAGKEAEKGFLSLLFFTAVLSVNLGLLNLLPIPILDGGHLVLFALEGVVRRPLDPRKLEFVQKAGLVLIVTLMILAFYNDITRLWRPPR